MKRSAFVIVLAGLSAVFGAWQIAATDRPGDAASSRAAAAAVVTPEGELSTTTSPSGAGTGYVLHIDESGRFIEEPAPGVAQDMGAALAQSVNTSSEGLVEVASPVAGGGVMVDLQGRFQTTSTATTDANGRVHVPCLANEVDVRSFTSAAAANEAAAEE